MDDANKNQFIAHVRQTEQGDWLTHDLFEHCTKVGELASIFAKGIADVYANLAGEFHDVGKYRHPFQERIRVKSGYGYGDEAHLEQKARRATHSTAGAKLLIDAHPMGVLLAYVIAGHHTGLPDWSGDGETSLSNRLESSDSKLELKQTQDNLPAYFNDRLQTVSKALLESIPKTLSVENCHVFVRFVFSCLVDADFLDTEQFMSPDKAINRGQYPSLIALQQRFEAHMQTLQATATDTDVNRIRRQIYQQSLDASTVNHSIFTLTVPTGGGKTLSSMAFALNHAITFGKKRIIYAIPFTTIIEQNARVFKQIFHQNDDTCVIEHHSNFDQPINDETAKSRLATENWDAPIIVTTNVQLFESLFAHRTSQCRKIHNIAGSVIVLDEAQKIPRDYQKPITDMMRTLSEDYGVTWVLCTATQPKLDKHTNAFGHVLLEGLPKPHRIIADEEQLAQQLKRVHIQFELDTRWSWEQTATHIYDEPDNCVLAIVNTRNNAEQLYHSLQELAPEALIIHLSAGMSPVHRELMITLINRVLHQYHQGILSKPFYVVSTQLIEAGVDVDFPVVYRAMIGLDSIAQSAGRCNREGELDGMGKVVVFQPEVDAPRGELLQAQQTTYEILPDIKADPLTPTAMAKYFKLFNAKGNPDKQGIVDMLTATREAGTDLAISFRKASKNFRMISNEGVVTVICPFYHQWLAQDLNKDKLVQTIDDLFAKIPQQDWLKGVQSRTHCPDEKLPVEILLDLLEHDPAQRWIYRKLQRHSITIPERLYQQNHALFYSKAGFIVAKDYDFFTGIVCDYRAMSGDDVVW